MATTDDTQAAQAQALREGVQTALANQARREELRTSCAQLMGAINATASASQRLNSINNDAQIQLAAKRAELAALEAGAGAGITDDFGPKSVVTQLIEKERFAAKAAVVEYVKANPECTEEDAAAQWREAGLATHPEFPLLIQDGLVMSALYRANLIAVKAITENTWEAHRQWILVTPSDVITSM